MALYSYWSCLAAWSAMAAAYQCSLKSQNSLYTVTVNDTRFLLQNQKLLPDIVMRNFGLVTIVKLKGIVE